MTAQLTLDTSGQIAESRPLQFTTLGETPPGDQKAVAQLFIASVTDALKGWRYEPARRITTFMVNIVVRPMDAVPRSDTPQTEIHLDDKQSLKRVRQIEPILPVQASIQRIQGVVIVEAAVAPDGKVLDVRVLRAIPWLDQAAVDAVVQWEFIPYTLKNGESGNVVTQLWLNFRLP